MTGKDEFLKTLKRLSEAFGVSGYEDEVRNVTIEMLEPYADSIELDSFGNIIALKKGSGEGRVMLAGHIDEIGLMVSSIDKNGFIKFQPVGGWNPIILPGQRVLIKTEDGGIVRGVIGHIPPHILKPEEAKKVPELKDLYIDVGASSKEDVSEMGIEIGSTIVIERSVERLGNIDRVSGKAFDDRVGVAVLIHAFREAEDHEADLYAVATVQEEVGLKGARVSAYKVTPDVALALDTTIAADVPEVKEGDQICKIGKGPAIKVMDGRSGSGLITHPEIKKFLIDIAKRLGIPYQLEVLPGGTTDASIIALNKEGVPSGVVSVPTRYVHSPVEVLDLNDCINAVKLTRAFVESITGEWVRGIKGGKIK